jgi:AbrB family looped-hinge helix DNA binding protein
MSTVTVSPKFQVVIPKDIRRKLGIKPGQKLQVFQYDNRIEYVLIRNVRDLKGVAKGIDTSVPDDEEDR